MHASTLRLKFSFTIQIPDKILLLFPEERNPSLLHLVSPFTKIPSIHRLNCNQGGGSRRASILLNSPNWTIFIERSR